MNLWLATFDATCEDAPGEILSRPRSTVYVATTGDSMRDVKTAIVVQMSTPPASNVQVNLISADFLGEVWV